MKIVKLARPWWPRQLASMELEAGFAGFLGFLVKFQGVIQLMGGFWVENLNWLMG